MSDVELSGSFPLDTSGFLRRACPTCGGEFKWLITSADATSSPPEEYFCPYCGASAAPNEWFTLEQRSYMNALVFDEVVRPSVEDMADSLRQLGKSSGGLIKFEASAKIPESSQAAPVYEPDDMKEVSFACHSMEPVKIDETWGGAVYCICCGQSSDAAS